jgi:hypothetical protein
VLPNRADGRDRTGDIRFTRAVLYQLSYVGVASASYRRNAYRRTLWLGFGAVAAGFSSWRDRVEVMGSCGCVQVAVVDEHGSDVVAHGERGGEVDCVHRA